MRILVPYLLLVLLLFFAARSYARQSRRARRHVLTIGWSAVAAVGLATVYLATSGEGVALQTVMTGFAAAAMLGLAVRSVQRRTGDC